MKKFIVFLLLLTGWTYADADVPSDLMGRADTAYMNERFEDAMDLWIAVQDSLEHPSPDIDYNIGNAAWRLNQFGYAILYWNRALKGDPDMKDARANLTLTEELKVDRIEPLEQSPVLTFFTKIVKLFTPSGWGFVGIGFWTLMTVSVLIFKRVSRGFYTYFLPLAFVFFLLGGLSTGAGIWHHHMIYGTQTAVVVRPNIYVKSAPMISGGDAFILHEGTEMEVTSTAGDWYEIGLADGKVGWVREGDVGVY